MENSSRPYIVAFLLAIFFAGSAYTYKEFFATADGPKRKVPVVQAPDTDHAHASLLVMIGDTVVNFCDKRFMLRSPVVHFEDNDCFVVHKHSLGVTFATFFKSIGVVVTPTCITTPDDGERCSNNTDTLRVVLNGKEVPVEELAYYEIKNNDHLLVNFGPEKDSLLRLKYNQVPPIPLDVNEPAPLAL